jgi:XTP/dITP diphosphohydrolase
LSQRPRLVLATHNRHKVDELRRILVDAGVEAELLDLDDLPALPLVAETGVTFEANARLKARAVTAATGLSAVADDSGICVDVLGGAPGVFSARWAGGHGDDRANLRLLLDQLADVPDGHRGARFTCAAVLCLPDGGERVVHGTLAGTLLREPHGEGGFGYDPIFVPTGHDQTTAEMTPQEKDAISHRGQAFRALAQALTRLTG